MVIRRLENFLRPLKVRKTPQKQGIAQRKRVANPVVKWVSNHENRQMHTFETTGSVLRVVRSHCLLWQIDMMVDNNLETYVMIIRHVENSLQPFEVESHPLKNTTFYTVFSLFLLQITWNWVSTPENCFFRMFETIEYILHVVWQRRLLWQIDMMLDNNLETYLMIIWRIENILQPFEVETHPFKNTTFYTIFSLFLLQIT